MPKAPATKCASAPASPKRPSNILLVAAVALVLFGAGILLRSRPPKESQKTAAQPPTQTETNNEVPSVPQTASTNLAHLEGKDDFEKATYFSDQGDLLMEARQYEQAAAAFRQSISYDPQVETVHYNLGITLARLGRAKEAVAAYQKALEIAPDYAEAHNNLGNALVKLGQIDQAISHFQEAIKISPEVASSYNNLGTALGRQRKFPEASEQFAKAVSLSPQYLEARFNLGNSYIELGMFDDAEREFNDILQMNPGFTLARQGLARLAAKKSRPN